MVFKHFLIATSCLICMRVNVNAQNNHEKFWGEPEFFSSLTDYLTTTPRQQPPSATPQSRVIAASEQIGTFVARPPPVGRWEQPTYQTFHVVQHQGWTNHRNPNPPQIHKTVQIMQNAVRNEITTTHNPEYATAENNVLENNKILRPNNDWIMPSIPLQPLHQVGDLPKMVEHILQYGEQQKQTHQVGHNIQPQRAHTHTLPHPNSLSHNSIDIKQTGTTRRRPPLIQNNKIRRKRPRTTTTTPTPANTGNSTIIKALSPKGNSTLTISSNTTTPTTIPSTSAPDYYGDYYDDDETLPPQNQQNVVPHSRPPPAQLHQESVPYGQHNSIPSNNNRAEILPSHQAYDSSEQFGVRVPAPQGAFYNHQIQSQFQHYNSHHQRLHLNPNVLIATPHHHLSNPQEHTHQISEQLAQSSNLFPVMEQDENYLGYQKQQNPGILTRINNILETGRKIMYFPRGVIDTLDHALAYAETNPYVSYVMGSVADSILGSTKGMSAAPPVDVVKQGIVKPKPPKLLIAQPNKPKDLSVPEALASSLSLLQDIKKYLPVPAKKL